ncbi:MAG: hypothetical protein AAFO06_01550 [Cyanobacteria bacterium J06597_16]
MSSLSTVTPLSDDDSQQVTAVISHLVKPQQVSVYEKWLRDVLVVAQQFEVYVVMPRITRLFYRWLYPQVQNDSSRPS